MGLALGITLKFYTIVKKGLRLKVRKFQGLIPMFVKDKRGNPVGGDSSPPSRHPEYG